MIRRLAVFSTAQSGKQERKVYFKQKAAKEQQ